MAPPRVLVVSSSAGHGHIMAAHSLTDALRRRWPTVDVMRVDALERTAIWYRKTFQIGYRSLADRVPFAWRILYGLTDRKMSALGHLITRFAGRAFVRLCERWQPDAVLCTHFLAAELLQRPIRTGHLAPKVHLVVTDFDVHRMWFWPTVYRYHVSSELVKARLCLRYGYPEEHIRVHGIPVRREFAEPHDRVAIRARYGLDPFRPVVLFLSTGFATGPMRHSILGIWADRSDVQILAVCGRNERLRRAVARLPRPGGALLHALGFVERPGELMDVADLVVAKGGGVTLAECLVAGKPVVVTAAIPGQEERNVHALEEAGAGVWAPTPEEVRWRVCRLLEEPDRLAAMSRGARALGRPTAALDIADSVAGELVEPLDARPRFHGAQ